MACCSVVILAVISASVVPTFSQTCPYDDVNCQCVNTAVRCRNLKTIPPLKTGSGVIAVDTLEIDDGNIANIPANSLPPNLDGNIANIPANSLPPNLVSVSISDNPLNDISDDAFLASAGTLDALSISNVELTRLPDALLCLTSLTNLTIMFTNIDDWNVPVLQKLAPSLRSLFLQDTGLTVWPTWVWYFSKLRTLDIDVDDAEDFPGDAFSSMNKTLTEFHFNSGNLTHIPKAMASLTNLTILDLGSNELLNVKSRPEIEQLASFPCVKTLLTLKIPNTGLYIVPNLSNFTKVTELDLSLNMISKIDSANFPPNLLNLDLNENDITEITDASFKNCSQLQILNLAYNPITTISWSAFSTHVWLLSLDLTRTSLRQIPVALLPLSKLTTLGMAGFFTLICPCPPLPEWISWYNSVKGGITLYGDCSDQGTIQSYLNGSCQSVPPCYVGNARPQVYKVVVTYTCLIMSFVIYVCRF